MSRCPIAAVTLLTLALCPVSAEERLTYHKAPKALPTGAVVEAWPRFLGARHDASSRETMLLEEWPVGGPEMVWELERGETYAAPTVSGGRLFSFDRHAGHERLECRDPETGELRWAFRYPVEYRDRYGFANGPRASPVIDGDRIYLAGVTGQLRCLGVAGGEPLWHRDLVEEYGYPQGFFGYGPAPFVWGDLLLVNVGGRGAVGEKGVCVAAFDKRTGEERWRYLDTWGASYSSPVVGEIRGRDVLLVLAGGESRPAHGGLLALDPATGELHSRFPWRADKYESVNASSPIVVGADRVFVSECYGKGGVMLEFDGALAARPVWEQRQFGMHWMTPLQIGDHLYGFAGRNEPDVQLRCARVSDGEIAWADDMRWEDESGGRTMLRSLFRGSLLAADGRVFALGEHGAFAELEMGPGGVKTVRRSQLFLAQQSWALPVVHRGLLYVGQHSRDFVDGKGPRLICYDFRRR